MRLPVLRYRKRNAPRVQVAAAKVANPPDEGGNLRVGDGHLRVVTTEPESDKPRPIRRGVDVGKGPERTAEGAPIELCAGRLR